MIIATNKIKDKLWNKHQVTMTEVEECFYNRGKLTLIDDRENNKTIPPTQWFIAETDTGRLLKIFFIEFEHSIIIKTAYHPNKNERRIYQCLLNQK